MLIEPAGEICGDTAVERCVGTFKEIDGPDGRLSRFFLARVYGHGKREGRTASAIHGLQFVLFQVRCRRFSSQVELCQQKQCF